MLNHPLVSPCTSSSPISSSSDLIPVPDNPYHPHVDSSSPVSVSSPPSPLIYSPSSSSSTTASPSPEPADLLCYDYPISSTVASSCPPSTHPSKSKNLTVVAVDVDRLRQVAHTNGWIETTPKGSVRKQGSSATPSVSLKALPSSCCHATSIDAASPGLVRFRRDEIRVNVWASSGLVSTTMTRRKNDTTAKEGQVTSNASVDDRGEGNQPDDMSFVRAEESRNESDSWQIGSAGSHCDAKKDIGNKVTKTQMILGNMRTEDICNLLSSRQLEEEHMEENRSPWDDTCVSVKDKVKEGKILWNGAEPNICANDRKGTVNIARGRSESLRPLSDRISAFESKIANPTNCTLSTKSNTSASCDSTIVHKQTASLLTSRGAESGTNPWKDLLVREKASKSQQKVTSCSPLSIDSDLCTDASSPISPAPTPETDKLITDVTVPPCDRKLLDDSTELRMIHASNIFRPDQQTSMNMCSTATYIGQYPSVEQTSCSLSLCYHPATASETAAASTNCAETVTASSTCGDTPTEIAGSHDSGVVRAAVMSVETFASTNQQPMDRNSTPSPTVPHRNYERGECGTESARKLSVCSNKSQHVSSTAHTTPSTGSVENLSCDCPLGRDGKKDVESLCSEIAEEHDEVREGCEEGGTGKDRLDQDEAHDSGVKGTAQREGIQRTCSTNEVVHRKFTKSMSSHSVNIVSVMAGAVKNKDTEVDDSTKAISPVSTKRPIQKRESKAIYRPPRAAAAWASQDDLQQPCSSRTYEADLHTVAGGWGKVFNHHRKAIIPGTQQSHRPQPYRRRYNFHQPLQRRIFRGNERVEQSDDRPPWHRQGRPQRTTNHQRDSRTDGNGASINRQNDSMSRRDVTMKREKEPQNRSCGDRDLGCATGDNAGRIGRGSGVGNHRPPFPRGYLQLDRLVEPGLRLSKWLRRMLETKKCGYCNYQCGTLHELEYHLQVVTSHKLFFCCERLFESEARLNTHLLHPRHYGKGPFVG
eukprot:GHVQ01037570.1.p1 GENE.GHVQ01037570.1~~GHVQ01037570.1.p1  ORF type:complete len:988 (+),score=176.41 GHVQ01037570.1:355-3318(+)